MRAIFHACVTGSLEAVDFYRRAFNAELLCCYVDSTGRYVEHAELALDGQSFLSIMEIPEAQPGNTMYFFFSFDDEESLREAYEILKDGAEVRFAPEPCEWCKLLTDFTDRYGVRWLLNAF